MTVDTSMRAMEADADAPRLMSEPIAIIGIGCRFPGSVNNPESYWHLLRQGIDAITETPASRFDVDAIYDPHPATPGRIVTRRGGFLDQVDQFDAAFFGISPREANAMDPQQRVLLEVAWEALEDAGLPRSRVTGSRTGVFVGMWTGEYEDYMYGATSDIDLYVTTGGGRYAASGRLSYAFDLRGPSLTIDTACSSSLVAVHLACQSLRSGESEMAVAAGVNLILDPHITVGYSKSRMLSPDGRCKFGDARADGYVRSEGVGVVILKPLSKARANGDPIRALICGSAVNNDGHGSGRLVAPSGQGQEAMLRKAYQDAGIIPGRVGYMEAHGTGTSVGDPVELGALGAVLAEGRSKNQPCAIGSVKTNIGHTEAASGMAGLIKAVLCLEHRAIPASLHFNEPNPKIPWTELPFVLQRELGPWPTGCELIAGVNSFGVTGTNAHVVLRGAPEPDMAHRQTHADTPSTKLLPLSANSAEALSVLARDYQAFLSGQTEDSAHIRDICYTAAVRRTHHEHRLAVVGRSHAELAERLTAWLQEETHSYINQQTGQKIVFVFPGQGSQWLGMGRDLFAQEPVFRTALLRCEQAMQPYVDWSLLEQLNVDEAHSRLNEIDVIQPALFAIQVALAALWRSWGVEPSAVVGHSMGEVAAAYVAGALSLEDAARVICTRSKLLKRVSGQGAMAVVELAFEEAQAALVGYEDRLSVAVSNSPRSSVLSGEPSALAEVLATLQQRDVFCRPVKVDVASHSPQMDALCADLLKALANVQPQAAVIPIYSTVTTAPGDGHDFDANYWARNLRNPVLFAATTQRLIDDGHTTFIEVSPHPILLSGIEETLQHVKQHGIALPSLRRNASEREVLLGSLGTLYTLHYPVHWEGLYSSGGRCVPLPTYRWQRKRYWLEANHARVSTAAHEDEHPILGRSLPVLAHLPDSSFWEVKLDQERLPFAYSQHMMGVAVLPAAIYVQMALAAARDTRRVGRGTGVPMLSNLTIHQELALAEGDDPTLQFIMERTASGAATFRIFARAAADAEWALYASGQLTSQPEDTALSAPPVALSELQAQVLDRMDGAAFYEQQAVREVVYSPTSRTIMQIWRGEVEALGQIELADTDAAAGVPDTTNADQIDHSLHPALLQAGLHLALAALGPQASSFTLKAVDSWRVCGPVGSPVWGHARLRHNAEQAQGRDAHGDVQGDIRLFDERGQTVAEAIGVCWQPTTQVLLERLRLQQVRRWLYEVTWQPQPHERTSMPRPTQPGSWLIFTDGGGVGAELATLLASRGDTPVLVLPGSGYSRLSDNTFSVDVAQPADFRRVLEETLTPDMPPCRGIIYLWSLNDQHAGEQSLSALQETQVLACGSVLSLVQALASRQVATDKTASPRLWLVTRAAQYVSGQSSELAPAQAALWGLGRVIAHEHPEIWGGLIDLDAASTEVSSWVSALWESDREDQIAIRSGQRYVARLTRQQTTAAQHTPLTLHPDGTYLITGGLGGLGLQVAQWLAHQGARYIALMGRSGVNSQATEALQALEQYGARVVVLRGDVSRAEDVERALADIRRDMPPLRGVIHAAGILDDGTLLRLDWEAFARVLAPKVQGAWNLHSATRDMPLDLFILFSSAMALLGTPGQGNYAAANAFLDTLAHYRHCQGLPALSVNWGVWANVGLAARADRADRLIQQGFGALTPEQALTALDDLLRQNVPQAAVLPMQWATYAQHLPQAASAPFLSALADEMQGQGGHGQSAPAAMLAQAPLLQQLADAAPAARYDLLLAFVRAQVAAVMHFDATARLDPQQGFFSSGMDSLMALELRNRLQTGLKRSLPSMLTFDYPNIAALTDFLLRDLFPPVATPVKATAEPDEMLAQLQELTEDELRKQLDQELQAIDEGLFS